jgi:hypothetical protein
MKYKAAILAALAAATMLYAADATNEIVTGNLSALHYPSAGDVYIVNLHNGAADVAADTVGADSVNYYGPYALTDGNGAPMFAGFRVITEPLVVASGDSFSLSYQVIGGVSLADTVGTWTAIDTTASGGEEFPYISLDSLPGKSIVFKLINVDSTQIEIANYVRVIFKKAWTWMKTRF